MNLGGYEVVICQAPKGENDEEERFFDITIEKGSNKVTINDGVW